MTTTSPKVCPVCGFANAGCSATAKGLRVCRRIAVAFGHWRLVERTRDGSGIFTRLAESDGAR
ncbi:MAG: hypothetical protein AB7N71_10350 [Phycisphaerae bacterium]